MKNVYICLILSFLIACNKGTKSKETENNDYKQLNLNMCSIYSKNELVVPFCSDSDTISVVTTPGCIYKKLNVKLLSKEKFRSNLYECIIKNIPIKTDTTLFSKLYTKRIVPIPEIKAIYEKLGIEYILKRYLDKSGSFYPALETPVRDYIIYLSTLHHIYFYEYEGSISVDENGEKLIESKIDYPI